MKIIATTAKMIMALLVSIVLYGCHQETAKVEKLPAVVCTRQVEEYSPEKVTEARYSAVVKPTLQIDVAFKGGGYVDSIMQVRGLDGHLRPIQEGDFVRRGAVLARLRQSDSQARINEQAAAIDETKSNQERAQTALTESEVARDSAKVVFERTARLFQSDSVTKPEYDTAKSNFEIAEARVREAKAQINVGRSAEKRGLASLSIAQLALKDCVLVSPMDGVVLKRNIEVGALASQGSAAYTLADARVVKVAFGVPDVELTNLHKGDVLQVSTEAYPGKLFDGRITDIAPDADPKSRVFNIEVSIPNSLQQLKIGMVCALKVHEDKFANNKPVLSVPMSAVIASSTTTGGYSVFVVREESGKFTALERPVKLGQAFGQMIAVLDGIKTGESVVTTGSTRIVNGDEVRVTN